METQVNIDIRIKNIGLSECMYKASFTNITNIDISDVVIEQLKEFYKNGYEKMKCILQFF